MIYTPDAWILMRTSDCVKVLAGWRGGYLYGDEWRLSSGVTNIESTDKEWIITNYSGSIYYCGKYNENLISVMLSMYNTLIENNCVRISIDDYKP